MCPKPPAKAFASQADLQEKKITLTKLSDHAYAYTAEGDSNTGIVIGDDAVMVIDTQATPVMAQDVAGQPTGVNPIERSAARRGAGALPCPKPGSAQVGPARSAWAWASARACAAASRCAPRASNRATQRVDAQISVPPIRVD